MNDTEMLDWLSERCYFPNDHPGDDLIVLVPERFSPNGSFTLNRDNDRDELRKAILKAATFRAAAASDQLRKKQ